jgi:hypothetical protein
MALSLRMKLAGALQMICDLHLNGDGWTWMESECAILNDGVRVWNTIYSALQGWPTWWRKPLTTWFPLPGCTFRTPKK